MTGKTKQKTRFMRHRRVRAKVFGTSKKPRLCVFRSANHVYAQLIDDEKGKTLAVASDLEFKGKKKEEVSEKNSLTRKVFSAYKVGELIAKKTLKLKIEKVAFDRGGYKYHGRVKSLAEGARAGGLKF
jgi:large subunit ribosomal protein L18